MQFSRTIISVVEMVPDVIDDFFDELKDAVKLDSDELFDIRLLLEEAMTNAIKHGNAYNLSLKVEVNISLQDNVLTIVVKDQGEGFDSTGLGDSVDEQERTMKDSGRGIFLIKKLAKSVEFKNNGSEIHIVREVSPSSQAK